MQWLLAGYMWLYIHRPFEIWPVLETMRLERVFMIATLLIWAVQSLRPPIANRLNTAFLAFLIVLLVSWITSPMIDAGTHTVEEQFKVAVFYVLVVTSVRDEKALRRLVIAYLIVVGLYMTHSLWEFRNGRHVYRMGIERLIGIDATYQDPNTFAATLIYSLPITLPFWLERPRGAARWALLYYTGLTVVCIVLTGSRAGLVGMGTGAVLLAWASEHRKKLFKILFLLAPLLWLATPDDLKTRFLTLIDSSYGPANAKESADSRIQGFYDGVALWQERPLAGYGPYTFKYLGSGGSQAHNLYGQLLGEMGTLGALSLLGIVLAFWGNEKEVRRIHWALPMLPTDFTYNLARSVSLAVVLLLVMGLAGHNLFRYQWMWFGAFQAIAVHCTRAKAQQLSSQLHYPGKL